MAANNNATNKITLLKTRYLNLRIAIFLLLIFLAVNSIGTLGGRLSLLEQSPVIDKNDNNNNNNNNDVYNTIITPLNTNTNTNDQMTTSTTEEKELKRPIIYTFFQQTNDIQTQENIQEQSDMLSYWKKSWYDAGWDPVILTLEHAKLHPDFETNTAMILELNINDYDVLCFQRWMAMVVVGGGFMSDYDVYPLHRQVKRLGLLDLDLDFLPNDGKFTNYDPSPKAGVPSFQSGTAEEWSRMFNEMMRYVPLHRGEFYSDMFAMREFYVDHHQPGAAAAGGGDGSGGASSSFYRVPKVVGHVMMKKQQNSENYSIDCDKYNGLIGFHLSHKAFAEALRNHWLDEVEGAKSRAVYAQQFLEKFRMECTEHGIGLSSGGGGSSTAHIYWQTEYPFDEIEMDESLLS